jgi:hypothetical protein
LNNDL